MTLLRLSAKFLLYCTEHQKYNSLNFKNPCVCFVAKHRHGLCGCFRRAEVCLSRKPPKMTTWENYNSQTITWEKRIVSSAASHRQKYASPIHNPIFVFHNTKNCTLQFQRIYKAWMAECFFAVSEEKWMTLLLDRICHQQQQHHKQLKTGHFQTTNFVHSDQGQRLKSYAGLLISCCKKGGTTPPLSARRSPSQHLLSMDR